MSQIEQWLAENYEQARIDRGWSWEQLADDFDRQGAVELAAWARARVEPVERKPKAKERAVAAPKSTRAK